MSDQDRSPKRARCKSSASRGAADLRKILLRAIEAHDDWTVCGELYAAAAAASSSEVEVEAVGLLGFAIEHAYRAPMEDRQLALNCVAALVRSGRCSPHEIYRAVYEIGLRQIGDDPCPSAHGEEEVDSFFVSVAAFLVRWAKIETEDLVRSLVMVAGRGSAELFLTLLGDRVDVLSLHARNGRTALVAAASSGNALLCEKILRLNPRVVDQVDGEGRTALMMACSSGFIDVMHVLLRHGADVEIQDSMEYTALFHAIDAHDRVDAAEVLLERGADAIRVQPHTKDTPFHVAARVGAWNCLALLIKRCGRVEAVGILNAKGETALDLVRTSIKNPRVPQLSSAMFNFMFPQA